VLLNQSDVGVGSKNVVIRNCIFEKTVIRHPFYIQSSNDVLITNNIIYGTLDYNDALIDRYYQHYIWGIGDELTDAEIDSIDVGKHMTKFDCAISYRGCCNIRIINNYFQDGIMVLNGSQAPTGQNQTTIKGSFYLFKDNVIKNYCVPKHFNNILALYFWDNIDNHRMVNNDEIDITYQN